MTVEERKKRQKELDERATTVPPPIRREARLEFDQRSAAVEKYQTPLDEDSKEEPTDPEPATIGKHYRAINYDLWTYWRMVHGSEAIKLQAPFNLGSLVVCVRCCSLYAVACISRRSCPSLGRNHGHRRNASRRWRGGLDDALRRRRREDKLTHWLIYTQLRTTPARPADWVRAPRRWARSAAIPTCC